MIISELYSLIEEVCPISGVDSDGNISFKDEATESEREAAFAVVSSYDYELHCCSGSKCCGICTEWKTAVDAGFTYSGNTFDMDDGTLAIVGSRLALSSSLSSLTTAQLTFYNSDHSPVVFADKAAFILFCQSLIDERNRLDQNRLSLKAQVEACAAEAEINAIDITTGW